MTSSPVTAVIVAWNAGERLAACVDSLRSSARLADAALQLVVVDNASQDAAVGALALEEGDVVVTNPVNAGYGVGAAQGLALATSPWALLVNPDVVVEETFVGALLRAAAGAPPHIATLVPEMRFFTSPHRVNCRGLAVDEIGVPAEIDAGAPVIDPPVPSLPVLGGSSGCCLLRMQHVRALGGPEPLFFAYLEDVDLALRLDYAGCGAVFVPDAVAFHVGSASAGKRSPLKVHLVARNRRLLFLLHGPHGLRATAWRAWIDVAHGVYSMLTTPVAPWAGRLEALRSRRYVRFLRRAKGDDTAAGSYVRPPRATLRATLDRKRDVLREHE